MSLRYLVAAVLSSEHKHNTRWEAQLVFGELTQGQMDKATVLDSTRGTVMHHRVRELLIA